MAAEAIGMVALLVAREFSRREHIASGEAKLIREKILEELVDRLNDMSLLKGSWSTAKAPTWAESLAEQKVLESISSRITDIGLMIWAENRAAGIRRRDFAGIQESLKRAAELKESEIQSFIGVTPDSVARPPIIMDPKLFKEFLDVQRWVLFQLTRHLTSKKKRPDFSGMSEADRAAEADRLRQDAFQRASRHEEGSSLRRLLEARARILDFDPKQGGTYFNSYWLQDLSEFDLAEESPIGPKRFTNRVFEDNKAEEQLCTAINILSVQVACSDVGFPISVYGNVIARDSTDFKRIYLFNCDRDHCQVIMSEDDPLILTGPKRGLALVEGIYVETDLKIRDHQGQDRELSKGILVIKSIVGRSSEECKVESLSLPTRLSTVEMEYAVVVAAVEATIAIEVLEGEFCGIVTAHTTSIEKKIALYDWSLDESADAGRGHLKMMRSVVCVCVKDDLIIIANVSGGKAARILTPMPSKGFQGEFTLGTAKMRLQVDWSVMDPYDYLTDNGLSDSY